MKGKKVRSLNCEWTHDTLLKLCAGVSTADGSDDDGGGGASEDFGAFIESKLI